MNLDTCSTTQCHDGLPGTPAALSFPVPDPVGGSIRIDCLDLGHAGLTSTGPLDGRVLWISLSHPAGLLGALLDETSFEGAWLETDGQARIRLAGSGETLIPAPLFHSPQSARAWLASELSSRIPDARGTTAHPATTGTEDSLAA